jgi:E3 ubiquitin-protein ligase BRE1
VIELKEKEYEAWAHAESLKMSLDEHILEMRVKEANEAEALSQQKLLAAEAEITELRQKLEASRRSTSFLLIFVVNI